jgi:ATP-binding cassette subfamily F protein 3
MLQINNLNKSFGTRALFKDLTLTVNPKEKIGLVGRNGCGKSSLFRIILNEMDFDSGSINISKNYKIGYLKQNISFSEKTVLEETSRIFGGAENEMWKSKKILSGLGFSAADMDANPLELSGGFKIRIELAKLLLSDSDLLLLDEPNNYLDIAAIRHLKNFLKEWQREFILITHDRIFMDSVITHCAAIHRLSARKIEGQTQKLYAQIAKDEEIYEQTRKNLEKKRKQTEIFISRFRAKARLAGMVQSRIKTLQKQENAEKLESIEDLEFSFSRLPFPAAKMLDVNNLIFGYSPERILIENLNFQVLRKERICIAGKNGKGKSTLLKLLYGALNPLRGNIKCHPELKINYYAQSDIGTLNPLKTVFEEIISSDSSCLPQKARDIAGSMMFSGQDALKKISLLSGGEKARVLFGKILASPAHLLLLDEPTNHLDIESVQSLIDAIDEFEGSIILATHNEEILYGIAQKLIVFDGGRVFFFDGGYEDFLNFRGWEGENFSALELNRNSKKAAGTANTVSSSDPSQKRKLKSRLIQEKSKNINPLKEEIAAIENKIRTLEIAADENNKTLIQASLDKNIEVLSRLPKTIKEMHFEIEALYSALSEKSYVLEMKEKYYSQEINKLS